MKSINYAEKPGFLKKPGFCSLVPTSFVEAKKPGFCSLVILTTPQRNAIKMTLRV
jgi:hypothetical protein